jgi:hypothetical protein
MSEVNESFQTKSRKRFVGKATAKRRKEETQQVENIFRFYYSTHQLKQK